MEKQKRDPAVELLRILACFIVVCVHVKLPDALGDGWDGSRIFISCLCADGVSIFLLITGFFLFHNNSFGKVLWRAIKGIVFPALLLMVWSVIFVQWVISADSITGCIQSFRIGNLRVIPDALLNWRLQEVPLSNHLWYVCTYVQCMLWFPLLKLLCDEEHRRQRRYVIALSLLAILITDIMSYGPIGGMTITPYTIVAPEVCFLLLGYELFQKKDVIKGNRLYGLLGLVAFVLGNLLRSVLQHRLYEVDPNQNQMLMWKSTPGVLMTVSFAVFILSINIRGEKLGRFIQWLGSYTFGIYLVHWALVMKFNYLPLKGRLFDLIGGDGASTPGEIFYTLTMAVVIFIISLLMSIVLRWIKQLILGFFGLFVHKKIDKPTEV